jgi:hypothetical protein
MPKFDNRKLGKQASGKPAELMITLVTGNGSTPVALPGAGAEDGLVSVLENGGTAAWTDRTATAEINSGGSIDPGANVSTHQLQVVWYKF